LFSVNSVVATAQKSAGRVYFGCQAAMREERFGDAGRKA
jgi:hypothetical protein